MVHRWHGGTAFEGDTEDQARVFSIFKVSPMLAEETIPIQTESTTALENLEEPLTQGRVSPLSFEGDQKPVGRVTYGYFTGSRVALRRALDGDTAACTSPLGALKPFPDRPPSVGEFESDQVVGF